MHIHFTPISANRKTGPIMVTTQSEDTCPPSCPFKGRGCYASSGGPLTGHWAKVSSGARQKSWEDFLAAVKGLWKGSLWRYGQAGDLPGVGNRIDVEKLREIVSANRGKCGYAYSHKPVLPRAKSTKPSQYVLRNREAIKEANANGFVINLSADSLKDADRKVALGIGPVAVVVSEDPAKWPRTTPAGHRVVICPNTTKGLTCAQCGLCAAAGRKSIVGLPAHSSGKRKVEAIIAS